MWCEDKDCASGIGIWVWSVGGVCVCVCTCSMVSIKICILLAIQGHFRKAWTLGSPGVTWGHLGLGVIRSTQSYKFHHFINVTIYINFTCIHFCHICFWIIVNPRDFTDVYKEKEKWWRIFLAWTHLKKVVFLTLELERRSSGFSPPTCFVENCFRCSQCKCLQYSEGNSFLVFFAAFGTSKYLSCTIWQTSRENPGANRGSGLFWMVPLVCCN